jgi:hypothetical protein
MSEVCWESYVLHYYSLLVQIYELELRKDYNLTISTQKSILLAFKGPGSIRSKILIKNVILEQVNHLKYLGNVVSCTNELNIN